MTQDRVSVKVYFIIEVPEKHHNNITDILDYTDMKVKEIETELDGTNIDIVLDFDKDCIIYWEE